MPNKQAILENVDLYSANELVKFIKSGIVTFEELCDETDGCFSSSARKEVERKIASSEEDDWVKAKSSNDRKLLENYLSAYPDGSHRDEARNLLRNLQAQEAVKASNDEWVNIDKTSAQALRDYIVNNPRSPHCPEARKIINKILKGGLDVKALKAKIKAIQTDGNVLDGDGEIFKVVVDFLNSGAVSSADLLNLIKFDHNFLRASVINMLLDNGYIDLYDIRELDIKGAFIDALRQGLTAKPFPAPDTLTQINKQSTEVYFWGFPSSGKSCALGGILSVANNGKVAKSMSMDNDCQGYRYMNKLSALFDGSDKVCTLPEGTAVTTTYEMGFDLEAQDSKVHPITCIDLAGELMCCMYWFDAGENLTTDQQKALDTLTNILIDNRTGNRKIHFFVIEYGAEDRLYHDLPQKTYLQGALRYIQRTGILKNDTDGIYLMISKADKINAPKGQMGSVLRDYISDAYAGFYNGLKKICVDNEINSGNVEIQPFSLGDVCFQDYCIFDERPATHVVETLLKRTKGFKTGKGIKILKQLKG